MKRISIVFMVILLFNFIFCNIAYAVPDNNTTNSSTGTALPFNASSMYQADSKGTVEVEGHEKEIATTQSSVGAILGILISPLISIGNTASAATSTLAVSGGYYHTDSEYGADKDGILKVSSIIFGEFILFDTIITNTTTNMNPSITPSGIAEMMDIIKETVAALFEILRYVSMGLFLILLLYCIITLGGTDNADTYAKQKALLKGWAIGFLFVFFSRYIITACNLILENVMESIWALRLQLENSGFQSFEFVVHGDILELLKQSGGMTFCAYGMLYLMLLWVTLKFFIKYFYRSLKVFFLIIMCPIMGVLYSFEAAHTGESSSKSNAIWRWFGSYVSLQFIQPIHAVLYLIFQFSAEAIAINAPLLGILFLMVLERAEKIIKAIFGLNEKIDIKGGK